MKTIFYLKEIYETSKCEDDDNEFVSFAIFFKYESIYFEDAVKETKCSGDMDEEIQAIKKNETCKIINPIAGKGVIGVR